MEKLILIKYGELTTKKQNRNLFIKILKKNIKTVLTDYKIDIISDLVRMYIICDNKDIDIIVSKIKNVFGIHSIVICYKVNTNTTEISNSIIDILKEKTFKTFKVVTNRALKTFPIKSMDFSAQMGSLILSKFDTKVDVHNPELVVSIELRDEYTYIYTDEIKGLGGYPNGIAGMGLLMLSGGIDSPVAGYLAMKRGVSLTSLYFESPPHTSLNAKNKVISLANILSAYGNIKLGVVPFTKLQEAIYKNVPSDYMITIMRRMMYRISEMYAQKINAQILINGESIGQVASQTLSSMSVINEPINIPVIRPVACFDKLEIIDIARKINTYDTSILPFEDCCTIFLPEHPVINPKLNKCIEYEKLFDYQSLVDECVNNIELINDLKEKDFSSIL